MSAGGAQQRFRLARIEAGQGVALSLLDLPAGACVSDGLHRVVIAEAAGCVDISRWRLAQIELSWPEALPAPQGLRLLAMGVLEGRMSRRFYQVPVRSVLRSEKRALLVQGLPAGTRISDGTHAITSNGEAETCDVLGWDLDRLAVHPPRGWHQRLSLRVYPCGLTDAEMAALGTLQLRLLSPNAYLSGPGEEVAQKNLPLMDIVVEGMMPEVRAMLSLNAQAQHAGFDADETLDDEALAALEGKLRTLN